MDIKPIKPITSLFGMGKFMGLLRLIFIFFGLAVCTEFTQDATILFRSYLAFFIMLALDYSRMMFKGISLYEKIVGYAGFSFCVSESVLSILAMGRNFVLQETGDTYYIISSETFRMFPYFKWNINSFFHFTALITMCIAVSELLIPFWNRFNLKKAEGEPVASGKKPWYAIWRKSEKHVQQAVTFEAPAADNNR